MIMPFSFTTIHYSPRATAMVNTNKPTIKKDRHSKILTAQGLRDRRVRLSIGIARKFFDLQDTLGFDKASETLEWLLTKSKTSIMELNHMKKSFTDSSSECELVSTTNEQVVDIDGANKSRKSVFHNLSKETREKARERARARTRAKLCTRKTLNSHTFLFGICDKSVAQVEHPSCYPLPNRAADIIEESIVIKRKLKPPVSNFDSLPLPSLPQSWDISSAIARSSFYAMFNANISTELQVYGKPWDGHNNNQSQH